MREKDCSDDNDLSLDPFNKPTPFNKDTSFNTLKKIFLRSWDHMGRGLEVELRRERVTRENKVEEGIRTIKNTYLVSWAYYPAALSPTKIYRFAVL